MIVLVGRAKTISPLSDKKEGSADEGLPYSASRGEAMHGYKDGLERDTVKHLRLVHLAHTPIHSEC